MTVLPLDEQAQLTTLLTQPHRKYHNINHINDCLAELEPYRAARVAGYSSFTEFYVTYAIWYHDVIYNPYSKQNEEASAQIFRDNAKNSFVPSLDDRFGISTHTMVYSDDVAYIIETTARHTVTQDFSMRDDSDVVTHARNVMLDIDLAGLGKPWTVFAQNSQNIHDEYYNTSHIDFLRGRINFWEQLCKRESLYYTEYFRTKYEENARRNIAQEMELLQADLRWSEAK